jgi:hypothetical protein
MPVPLAPYPTPPPAPYTPPPTNGILLLYLLISLLYVHEMIGDLNSNFLSIIWKI